MVGIRKIKMIICGFIGLTSIAIITVYFIAVSQLVNSAANLGLYDLGERLIEFSPQYVHYLWAKKWLNDDNLTEFGQQAAVLYGVGHAQWDDLYSPGLNKLLLPKLKSDNIELVNAALVIFYRKNLIPSAEVIDELYSLASKYKKSYSVDERISQPTSSQFFVYQKALLVLLYYEYNNPKIKTIVEDFNGINSDSRILYSATPGLHGSHIVINYKMYYEPEMEYFLHMESTK